MQDYLGQSVPRGPQLSEESWLQYWAVASEIAKNVNYRALSMPAGSLKLRGRFFEGERSIAEKECTTALLSEAWRGIALVCFCHQVLAQNDVKTFLAFCGYEDDRGKGRIAAVQCEVRPYGNRRRYRAIGLLIYGACLAPYQNLQHAKKLRYTPEVILEPFRDKWSLETDWSQGKPLKEILSL